MFTIRFEPLTEPKDANKSFNVRNYAPAHINEKKVEFQMKLSRK